MIKLPKEVAKIIKTLTDAKQEAFAVGDCVRDALLGRKPIGWDVATDADFTKLRELFPEAQIHSEKYKILRMEFIEEHYDDEGKFAGEDGIIVDVGTYRKRAEAARESLISREEQTGEQGQSVQSGQVRQSAQTGSTGLVLFSDKIEDDVARRAFTMNAIADNPYRLVDPYNGREDIKKKLGRSPDKADALALTFAEPVYDYGVPKLYGNGRVSVEEMFSLAEKTSGGGW